MRHGAGRLYPHASCLIPHATGPLIFLSRHHPDTTSRAVALFRAQGDALAWGALALMTVTLAAVLEGASVWGPFAAGALVVYVASALVSRGRLDRTPAAIEVDGSGARLWSVWDASLPPRRPDVAGVHEARLVRGELVVSMGDAVETFQPTDWPDFEALVDAMRAAAGASADGA